MEIEVIASLEPLRRQLTRETGDALRSVDIGMRTEAERILKRAQEYAPVDTGALRQSGRIEVLRRSRRMGRTTYRIVFGGVSAPYANEVHETHHNQAKFLERAILESRQGLSTRVRRDADVAARRSRRRTGTRRN